MSQRLFTRAEVDALIPKLNELMSEAMDLYRRASALQEALEEQREKIRSTGGASVDRRGWKAPAEGPDRFGIQGKQGLARVPELGWGIKDLEMGLVDVAGPAT